MSKRVILVDDSKVILAMKNTGFSTLGQNKESCVLYGMPKVAFEMGAIDKQVDIEFMALKILKTLY